MLNEYHFVTRWRVDGSAEEVYDIIHDPVQYPRWWPAVYLDCFEVSSGDAAGLQKSVRFHTKGWLPYTLRWESTAVRTERPNLLEIRATGDFDGRGIWTFSQDGDFTDVSFYWQLRADKPLLRYLSPGLKPLFAANHRWAMEQGERSLKLELMRRHAETPEEFYAVPPPPPPNRTSGLVLAGAGLGLVATVLATSKALRRRETETDEILEEEE